MTVFFFAREVQLTGANLYNVWGIWLSSARTSYDSLLDRGDFAPCTVRDRPLLNTEPSSHSRVPGGEVREKRIRRRRRVVHPRTDGIRRSVRWTCSGLRHRLHSHNVRP